MLFQQNSAILIWFCFTFSPPVQPYLIYGLRVLFCLPIVHASSSLFINAFL
ncbi:hypothetical protein HanPI659440_Chr05g0211651 [Helianthus annuus]|nr:hypothetical protein HanPI659440_Chr05g0211651 [Helianthus annuus]